MFGSSFDFIADIFDRFFSHLELVFSLKDIIVECESYLTTLFFFLPGFLQPICFGMLAIAIILWVVNLL